MERKNERDRGREEERTNQGQEDVMMPDGQRLGFDRVSFGIDTASVHEDAETLTVDAVIAREMVQDYPEGRAYKSAEELEKAAWTFDGCWVVPLNHPKTVLLTDREDIAGRVTNPVFVKNLKDPKTGRPMDRGIRATITWFKSKVDPKILDAVKTGAMRDVSIGFTCVHDYTPGEFRGQKYDFVQRHITGNHVCAPCAVGRCPSPLCGIGIDSVPLQGELRAVGDPWEETEESIRSGHRDPEDFDPDSFRTIEITPGIKAVVGCPKGKYVNGKCTVGTEVQSFIFSKEKFNMVEAKKWYKEHSDTVADAGGGAPAQTAPGPAPETPAAGTAPANPCPLTEAMRRSPEEFARRLKQLLPKDTLAALLHPAERQTPAQTQEQEQERESAPPQQPDPPQAGPPEVPASPLKGSPAAAPVSAAGKNGQAHAERSLMEQYTEVMGRARRLRTI